MDPQETSSLRGYDSASDTFCEDDAKDSNNSYEPHSNDDSISRKSPDCVDEMQISQLPMTDSNLSGNEIEAINETTNKTAVSNSANQIDKFSAIQVMKLQYEKLNTLEKSHIKLQTTVEKIRQLLLNRTEVLHHPKNLSNLPFPAFEDAKTAEDLTNGNPSIKDYIVKKLMFASSGKCEKDCSKKVMALLMTNHTGTFFNWKGGKGKQPFGSWHLKEIVITAVKKLRGDKLDTGKAEDGIKEWLKERCFRKK
ncbi:uncharacterized protein LOC105207918 [Solenopsis invicta]|uniref:uncharacterized protein LOC105207918 n=1 Tax=Solenopsis invicta TaxID=13686 RepID=UPI00193CF1DE|nr:uncharacterized protein LOC105207918 [Solenopsis invicta]XP_039302023.1 uncharacterized protein LOC105207918 [Solenopsis invicta]